MLETEKNWPALAVLVVFSAILCDACPNDSERHPQTPFEIAAGMHFPIGRVLKEMSACVSEKQRRFAGSRASV